MPKILVVDDEYSIRESFVLILEGQYKVIQAASGEAALKKATDDKIDLAFLDMRMPGMDGLETLKKLKQIDPELEIIMVTAVNDVHKASEAIKYGARDYVIKPFDVENILKLAEQTLLKKSIITQGAKVTKASTFALVGQNKQIEEIKKTIKQLDNKEPILIVGEAGTEKETIAKLIHEQTNSSNKLDIFYLSTNMSKQEIITRYNLLLKNNSETLFIDNIELLPEDFFKETASATNGVQLILGASPGISRKLKIEIRIPPLRDRSSDTPLLINYFIEQNNQRFGKTTKISPEATKTLINYSWPGNTKELEALLAELVLIVDGEIDLADLPIKILLESSNQTGNMFFGDFESNYVQQVFQHNEKNRAHTATFLGITPIVLDTKL